MTEKFDATKTCKNCNETYIVALTKYEAAFEELSHTKISSAKCPNCGSTEYQRGSRLYPKIDKDLMTQWAQDEQLSFSQQDEDLLLASEENMDLILEFIESTNILGLKRTLLISVLCVMIYDNEDKNASKRAFEFLSGRKQLLEEAREHIYEYIGKKVYPKFGLKWKD